MDGGGGGAEKGACFFFFFFEGIAISVNAERGGEKEGGRKKSSRARRAGVPFHLSTWAPPHGSPSREELLHSSIVSTQLRASFPTLKIDGGRERDVPSFLGRGSSPLCSDSTTGLVWKEWVC